MSLLLFENWPQTQSQVLQEVEKKRKLDEVERYEFSCLFQYNVFKLMEERGYLQWKPSRYEIPQGSVGLIPIAKCSADSFVKNLKTSDPNAYRMLIRRSLNPEAYSQKEHRYLIRQTKERLQRDGYEVYGGKSKKAIEKLRKLNQGWLVGVCQGKDRYPDLVAFKNSEFLIVEIASSKTRLVRQLEYDQMAGETVLVLPIPTEKLKVWGVSELYEEDSKRKS